MLLHPLTTGMNGGQGMRTTIVATVAAIVMVATVLAAASPAAAVRSKHQCVKRAGDGDALTFCLRTRWRQAAGNDLVIKDTRVCASGSLDGTGFGGLYKVRTLRAEVRSGKVRHQHHGQSSHGRRCWWDRHDTRIRSGLGQVYVRFKIDWSWWFDDDETIAYQVP